MPSSDYANAVRGGLKLKGAKDSGGVKKHKKKEKKQQPSKSDAATPLTDTNRAEEEEKAESALQKALLDEDGLDEDAMEGDGAGALRSESGVGKTEAQRRHEERRKKRVCSTFTFDFGAHLNVVANASARPYSWTKDSSARASRRIRSGWRS